MNRLAVAETAIGALGLVALGAWFGLLPDRPIGGFLVGAAFATALGTLFFVSSRRRVVAAPRLDAAFAAVLWVASALLVASAAFLAWAASNGYGPG